MPVRQRTPWTARPPVPAPQVQAGQACICAALGPFGSAACLAQTGCGDTLAALFPINSNQKGRL